MKTDHSEELGREVARLLENALSVYAKRFPLERIPARRSRVWLFASEPGYHGYAGDLGRDLHGSAGIYDASLRELVLFLPADRTRFNHTVRHEGFHRFMHDFLDAPPPWFAEGCAEYYSSGRDLSGGAFATGRPVPEYVALLTGQTEELTPYRDLFLLDSKEFMANPGPHYAQSWAAVHFLLDAKDGALSKVFADYWAALREGLSAAEAFDNVLAPVVDRIERGVPEYVRSLR